MADRKRPIFRPEAIRRYAQARERSVRPRLIRPRSIVILWLLLVLTVAGGTIIWAGRIPVYASGTGVVVAQRGDSADGTVQAVVVIFLPPDAVSQLAPKQPVLFHLNAAQPIGTGKLVTVEPDVLGPDEARQRFLLRGGSALAITGPAAVAVARLDVPVPAGATTDYSGSIGVTQVRVGTQRIAALLPVIGRFLEG